MLKERKSRVIVPFFFCKCLKGTGYCLHCLKYQPQFCFWCRVSFWCRHKCCSLQGSASHLQHCCHICIFFFLSVSLSFSPFLPAGCVMMFLVLQTYSCDETCECHCNKLVCSNVGWFVNTLHILIFRFPLSF